MIASKFRYKLPTSPTPSVLEKNKNKIKAKLDMCAIQSQSEWLGNGQMVIYFTQDRPFAAQFPKYCTTHHLLELKILGATMGTK